jgi:hypothetical protein
VVVQVGIKGFGVANGFLTTAYSYTNDQVVCEVMEADLRRTLPPKHHPDFNPPSYRPPARRQGPNPEVARWSFHPLAASGRWPRGHECFRGG